MIGSANADTPAPRLSNKAIVVVLVVLSSSIYLITAYTMTHFITGLPNYVTALFTLAVLAAASLALVVASSLYDLYRSARAGLQGARLHRRLVILLSLVAVLPAVVAFTLSGTVLRSFSDEYFVDRVTEANLVARDFANGYLDAESAKMGVQIIQLARDLGLQANSGMTPETSPIGFRKYLLGQSILRGFAAVVLIDRHGQIISQVTPMQGRDFPLPPASDFVDLSAPGATPYKFNAVNRDRLDMWYAIFRLGAPDEGFLVAYKAENPALSQQLVGVREFRDQTKDVRVHLAGLSQMFVLGYGLVMVLLLLGAVWIGLWVANQIIGPVRRLAVAAEAVSSGDLTSRVDVHKGDGELGDLGHAFNEMTQQLAAQRGDLVAANAQSEGRRRFIETVISGVPAGVLNVSPEGRIALANPSAESILATGEHRGVSGESLEALAPELEPLIERARAGAMTEVRDQVEIRREGIDRILNVRISPDDPARKTGFVVTLDDITELVAAQRNAAWGDVARRIAHEIKNPLTPIQLSAERLRRRYGEKVGDDREIFDRCTDTIIRHVGDIGRMVNEFSSFARMPEPIMAKEDLCEIVRSAGFSFGVSNPTITFVYDMPDGAVNVRCDGRLIGQVMVNLIKNAVEAITEEKESEGGKIVLSITQTAGYATIDVMDTGRGLPSEGRSRLTEPYMTTRTKGTGLGLAIVRKAVEEHGGTFRLIDRGANEKGGATARIVLPIHGPDGEGIDHVLPKPAKLQDDTPLPDQQMAGPQSVSNQVGTQSAQTSD
ncbi:MAG: PAS domain-containing sensor histidine kinase [Pseudomonadota bacterium]